MKTRLKSKPSRIRCGFVDDDSDDCSGSENDTAQQKKDGHLADPICISDSDDEKPQLQDSIHPPASYQGSTKHSSVKSRQIQPNRTPLPAKPVDIGQLRKMLKSKPATGNSKSTKDGTHNTPVNQHPAFNMTKALMQASPGPKLAYTDASSDQKSTRPGKQQVTSGAELRAQHAKPYSSSNKRSPQKKFEGRSSSFQSVFAQSPAGVHVALPSQEHGPRNDAVTQRENSLLPQNLTALPRNHAPVSRKHSNRPARQEVHETEVHIKPQSNEGSLSQNPIIRNIPAKRKTDDAFEKQANDRSRTKRTTRPFGNMSPMTDQNRNVAKKATGTEIPATSRSLVKAEATDVPRGNSVSNLSPTIASENSITAKTSQSKSSVWARERGGLSSIEHPLEQAVAAMNPPSLPNKVEKAIRANAQPSNKVADPRTSREFGPSRKWPSNATGVGWTNLQRENNSSTAINKCFTKSTVRGTPTSVQPSNAKHQVPSSITKGHTDTCAPKSFTPPERTEDYEDVGITDIAMESLPNKDQKTVQNSVEGYEQKASKEREACTALAPLVMSVAGVNAEAKRIFRSSGPAECSTVFPAVHRDTQKTSKSRNAPPASSVPAIDHVMLAPLSASMKLCNSSERLSSRSEPYFEFSIFMQSWSSQKHEPLTHELSTKPLVSASTANLHAKNFADLFIKQYTECGMNCTELNTTANEHDCATIVATLASIEFPNRKTHLKVYVQRDFVSKYANKSPEELGLPSFVAKQVYVLRCFKLLPMSKEERKSTADDQEEQYHRIYQSLESAEVYTTLRAANVAAMKLEIELIRKRQGGDVSDEDETKYMERLRQKLDKLSDHPVGGEGYWKAELGGCKTGNGGEQFEIVVEKVHMCGPRNL